MTDSMSDEEIRENLLKLGQNIGPVVDSTRAFYRKKLAKLLGEIKDEPVSHGSGGSGTEGSASEDETNEDKDEQVGVKDKRVEVKDERVEGKLFSDSYSPPTMIRGRRSVNAVSSSPVKSSYRSSPTFVHGDSHHLNPPAQKVDYKNIVMILCVALGSALILYLILFHGSPSETAIESN